jgi:hypothetical protein
MALMLNVHYTRISDMVVPDQSAAIAAPLKLLQSVRGAGRTRLSANGIAKDTREPDVVASEAQQHAVEDLPDETLVFRVGSRYCETDRLSEIAWSLFGKFLLRWACVQSICD